MAISVQCDRCRNKGRCGDMHEFMRRVVFAWAKDQTPECADFWERSYHGVDGVPA